MGTNIIILNELINTKLLIIAGIFGIENIDYPTVAAFLGVLGIVGGVIIKIFDKPHENYKEKIEILEIDLKEYKKEIKEEINRITNKITEDRDKDIEARDKAIEKIENRIDKLFDYITKLLDKI